jgi:hypothetical protein
MSSDGTMADTGDGPASMDRLRPTALQGDAVKAIARDRGADDRGVVSIDMPGLEDERSHVPGRTPKHGFDFSTGGFRLCPLC